MLFEFEFIALRRIQQVIVKERDMFLDDLVTSLVILIFSGGADSMLLGECSLQALLLLFD